MPTSSMVLLEGAPVKFSEMLPLVPVKVALLEVCKVTGAMTVRLKFCVVSGDMPLLAVMTMG
jgi:hypothetical protein